MENWKKSPLAYEFVEVSDQGRARILERSVLGTRNDKQYKKIQPAKIISPWVSKNGYFCIAISHAGKRTKYLLHRLIASAFCEGFDHKITVNHKNGNKLDNLPENLEWVTLAANTMHEWETGLVNLRGEGQPGHKLKRIQVADILNRLSKGCRVAELAQEFSVSQSTIYKIRSGTRWVEFS